ncbi:MAG: ribonuclease E inhibitor RraB [Flavobacteriales bacterium]
MGLFDFFNNRQKRDELRIKRLELEVTKRRFHKLQSDKQKQMEMVPWTVQELFKLGISQSDNLKLEFFFYGPDENKAMLLHKTLINDFSYDLREIHKNKNLWVVTGWTTPQPIATETIQKWSSEMCDLAYKYDMDFDGWGTTPEQ